MQLNNLSVKRETMLHKDDSWVQVGRGLYKKNKIYETWVVCRRMNKGIISMSMTLKKEKLAQEMLIIQFSEPVCKWDGHWGQLKWKQEGKE